MSLAHMSPIRRNAPRPGRAAGAGRAPACLDRLALLTGSFVLESGQSMADINGAAHMSGHATPQAGTRPALEGYA